MDLDFEQPIADIQAKIDELKKAGDNPNVQFSTEIAELERELAQVSRQVYSALTPWQTVQVARHAARPLFGDYAATICSEFIELHGDRHFGDDRALLGGLATIDGLKVMLLGMEKGKSVEEKIRANFGMANPEGYRKALRLMRLAEKYRIPIVCLIDTPAAYPGAEAEARGQAEAIARNLTEMIAIDVPIVVVVTGEGGSGGALGIAIGDSILMLKHSIYSVIPPEGCAAILWRDGAKAAEAADALKLTADSLLEIGVIDEIIPEPPGGAHRHREGTMAAVRLAVVKHLGLLKRLPDKKLVERRLEKFSKIGKFDRRKYSSH